VFFTENIGDDSTVHTLVTPFQCKVTRIYVESFLNRACLRLELLGYPKDGGCNHDIIFQQMGNMKTGHIY
jgi:hypothetical protein